ncbi:O-antigen ligase family protein [Caldimonas tepidiphila]|uniref:O-antigen ligase family protein n=1 Tax=Caldimonas tepidiphila TaxID=2315841 RepID=UPI000E5AB217|nr:O-antigen ligase family protein [Caldimonas tepidiphila]
MFLLRVLLIAIIVYLPTHETFGFEFTLKGLNVINILFALSLLTLLAVGSRAKGPTPLKRQFLLFFAMLGWAFLVGAMRDSSALLEDLTMLKNSVFYMLLFFLVYHSAQDLKTVWVLFATVLLVTFLASLQGLQQAAAYGLSVYDESRRVSAPFGDFPANANRAAMFFAIFLPLFAAIALFCKSRPVLRLVAAGCFALGTFVVFFTYSRQAYVILALLALLLAVRRNLFVSLLIGVAVLNYQVWAPDTAVTRLQMTQKSGGADAGYVEPVRYDESTASRFVLWQGAAEMLAERPWGSGLNHFKREIGHYVPQYAGKDAHNFYVLITAEAGPFGLIATGVLLLGLLRLGRQVRTVDGSETSRMLGIGYTMSVFAVMLSNVYGSRFLDHDVMGNFWILTALVARYYSLVRESTAAPATKPAAQVPGLRRPVPAL